MRNPVFFLGGSTPALTHAGQILERKGQTVAVKADPQVTHLLLPVPSFCPDGTIQGGKRLEDILAELPDHVTVLGGNLKTPALDGYQKVDFLQDPLYLAENANITAHCAVKLALDHLPVTLLGCHVLVVGWGRIGKCLAELLRAMGTHVAIAARKPEDRAILKALGYGTEVPDKLTFSLMRYRVIFNTAPAPVLPAERMVFCQPECLKIDLASTPGLGGDGVIWARGLPGKDAPESSGELIARTAIRLAGKETVS